MIRDWLEEASRLTPERPAMTCIDAGKSLNYSQLREAVERASAQHQPRAVVPIEPSRSLEDAVAFLGILWAGAVPQLGGQQRGVACSPNTAVRLYTSGSTGAPQVVDLSVEQIRASVLANAAHLGQGQEDAWLCVLPLSHVGGMSILLRCLYGKSEVVLGPEHFDAERTSRWCQEGRVSQVSLVPTQLQRMIPHLKSHDPGARLRLILLGGAAAPEALMTDCRQRGLPVARTWGMSECASQVATEQPGSFASHLTPLPGVVVGRDSASGRLWIEGAIAPEGRFLSSDLGQVSEKGVIVEGRMDDLLVSGGENLSMPKIRDGLLAHPGVKDAAVIKRPSVEWGERPHAVLVAQLEAVDTQELLRFLKDRGFRNRELPDTVEWRDELPRTALGKLQTASL